MTEQQMEHPETLFYEGQSGYFLCSEDNIAFIEAAEEAGYEQADRFVTAMLDDGAAVMELPVRNDMVLLPECPQDLIGPYEEDLFFANAFAGWTVGEGEEGTIWKAGEYLDIRGQDVIDLYSSWKLTERHPLEVMVERADGIAAYTVIDSDTGKEPEAPARYVFLYQWQISDATPSDSQYLATASDADLIEEEATASNARATASNATRAAEDQSGWMDIEGEDDPVYERIIGEADGKLRFRCMVTAVSLLRSRAAGSQVVMYSEPAAGAATEVTVYVDQASGNDSNNGMEETTPFKTLGKAAEALKQNSGGDVHSNRIVLLSDYQLQSTDLTGDKWFNGIAVPATISGKKETIKLTGVNGEKADNNNFTLTNPIIFENLTLNLIGHIYCDGNDITIGQGITTKGYPYLYGAGNSTMPATMNNTISVQSGHISRIAGYVRANSNVDVGNKPVAIEVSGGTVDTIIAGSANGNIKNAKVKIDVSGGNVTTLTGGCQGFQNQQAEYTGITEIDISGGKVTNLYGAGTGRDISAPVFKGKLDIHVSGGEVTKICGSGSAASVASDEAAISNPSQVNITVSGGTVKDIYAAGRGGDDSVSTYNGTTMTTETAKDFGSLKGKATITIEGQAIIGGDIYASGEGYVLPSGKVSYGQKNAYLDGTCTIVMKGGTVKGNIYGGGKGIDQEGCSECARVTEDSKVIISMEGGTVEGDVYGGGRIARSFGSTSVNIVENVTIHGNVYGGAYGKVGDTCVYGSSTVNMTGGWIRGNLYGGSNLSDTGEVIPEEGTPEYITKKDLYDKHNSGLVFVNLVGGTVDGKVFGGGNKGIVNGSTHLHIGTKAIGKCRHYSDSRYTADSPDALQPRTHLAVGGSVYAGGDYGNEQTPGEDGYNTETVTGYSHVYIDGEGYRFRSDGTDRKLMELSGGVFGSGASCDAGSVRLVTLDHFGERITDGSGKVTGTYGKLTSIQRADQVRLINSHVQLSGQSDAANQDKTALYALNRIGDTTEDKDLGKLGDLENSLVLKGGSTLVLDSESIKIANYKSVDDNDKPVGLTSDESALSVENTVLFTSGTTLHVSYTGEAGTDAAGSEIHGSVSGYSYMEIADQAEAYIYARLEPKPDDPVDGGFAAFGEKGSDGKQKMIDPIKVEAENYRYWKLAEEYSVSERQTVLTARRDTASSEEYICAKGTIELPPAGSKATYQITKIELSPNVTFANAAMDQNGTWQYASTVKTEDDKTAEHNKIKNGPLKTFGLFMHPGKGFGSETQNTPMVISSDTIDTIISTAPVTLTNATPQVEFYLTYYNPGITISQDLGSVKMTAVRTDENGVQDTIILQIDLVTKATELVAQTIDLYATQSGSYTGKWIIPAEADRTMRLIKVTTDATGFVPTTGSLSGNQFAVAMQPEKGLGWKTNDLMSKAHFLQKNDSNILLGSTDNRYEAPVHFTLYNAGGFSKKENPDTIKLTFGSSGTDGKETPVDITLNIHWNESVVSKIDVASGKHYDVFTGESGIVISGESAVTSAFTLGKAITPRDLWMELQDKDGNVASLPAGTNLTMLKTGSTKYYRYQATGDETEHRIQLTGFKEMWTGTPFSENLLQNDVLMVIMEFDNSGSLKNGEYSLHLRDDRSADTAMADFTVNNTQVSVALRGGDGLQEPKAKYDLTLTVNAGNDTRLSKGTAAVFTLDDGKPFPDGTVFTHDGKTYTPMNGKVYMLLDSGVSEHTIAMDTTGSAAGLEEGKHYLTAKILSVGLNAGSKVLSSDGKVDYTVKALPQYGLKVESNDKRNVGAGSQITFTVTYSVSNVGTKEQVIGVTARKKSGASYEEGISWSTSGNSPISPEAGSASGSQTIQVTVPQDIEPGTYRLVFTLGEKTAVYNIIVTAGN